MLVTICVITYQRPEGLRRLLEGLAQLTFCTFPEPEVRIVVVDNDKAGAAYRFCQSLKSSYRWPLVSCIEPCRGISYARNRAIACTASETDFVAFIDDDEVPDPAWLEQLLKVQASYQADVVHGPVISYFPKEIPAWISKGNFFEQTHYPTGHLLEFAYTNNVLVRTALLKMSDKPFDERFALTGGEDSYFFRNLYCAGYKIVWSDAAIVYEWIPQSRTTMRWILQRGYRSCLTYTLWEKEAKPSIVTKIASITRALGLISLGIVLMPLSCFSGRSVLVRSLLHICRGGGKISGLLGLVYKEYRTIHPV